MGRSTPIIGISEDDIRIAVRHPSVDRRSLATQKICRKLKDGIPEDSREFAHKILHHIMQDTAAMVRRALAVTLRNSPELPASIARQIIADIDNIAVPVLLESPVLSEQDLLDVLNSRAAAKIRAVAKRPNVSGDLVDKIIGIGDNIAIATLVANDGAEMSARTAEKIIDLYKNDDLIKAAMIERQDIPVVVAEKLVTLVSEEAAWRITQRHALPVDIAVDICTRAKERATLEIIDHLWVSRDLMGLARELANSGRLTNSLIMRAAGCGMMAFVEHALAVRAEISFGKARIMLHDTGPLGVQAVGARAGFKTPEIQLLRAAVAIFRDLEETALAATAGQFQARMIERLLSLDLDWDQDQADWFLERLDGLDQGHILTEQDRLFSANNTLQSLLSEFELH